MTTRLAAQWGAQGESDDVEVFARRKLFVAQARHRRHGHPATRPEQAHGRRSGHLVPNFNPLLGSLACVVIVDVECLVEVHADHGDVHRRCAAAGVVGDDAP